MIKPIKFYDHKPNNLVTPSFTASLSAVSLAKLTVLCADENCYGVDENKTKVVFCTDRELTHALWLTPYD